MGPLPRSVLEVGQRALLERAQVVGVKPDDFFSPAERVREQFARLINASAEQVAFCVNTSSILGAVAKQLNFAEGSNLVILENQFPSNVYAWRSLCKSQGLKVKTIRPGVEWAPQVSQLNDRARDWNARVLEAIDTSTSLVALETAHWMDGTLFDLKAISKRCRDVGALLVIDATQTMGVLPFDAKDIQPDLLVVHPYKSMLCNYGLGFAYLSERFAAIEPTDQSWLTRKGSRDFTKLTDYQDEFDAGMRRFDTSSRANAMLILMLEESLRLFLEWNPSHIRSYLYEISSEPLARLCEHGFGVADRQFRAPNLFGISLPKGFHYEKARTELSSQNIHVSIRGSILRVSPHVYNDAEDLNRLVDSLVR